MIQVAGLINEVYAHSNRRVLAADTDIDDTTWMLFKFANGATGSFSTIFVTGEIWRVLFGNEPPFEPEWNYAEVDR